MPLLAPTGPTKKIKIMICTEQNLRDHFGGTRSDPRYAQIDLKNILILLISMIYKYQLAERGGDSFIYKSIIY